MTLQESGGGGQQYKVGENTLTHLDRDGDPITGDLVIGKVSLLEVIVALRHAEEELRRELNPVVMSRRISRSKP